MTRNKAAIPTKGLDRAPVFSLVPNHKRTRRAAMKIERNNLVYALGLAAPAGVRRSRARIGTAWVGGRAPSFGDVFMIVAVGGPCP